MHSHSITCLESEEACAREMHIDVNVMYVIGRVSEARRALLDW